MSGGKVSGGKMSGGKVSYIRQARPWFFIMFYIISFRLINWFYFSTEYSNSMVKIAGKRSDPVKKL